MVLVLHATTRCWTLLKLKASSFVYNSNKQVKKQFHFACYCVLEYTTLCKSTVKGFQNGNLKGACLVMLFFSVSVFKYCKKKNVLDAVIDKPHDANLFIKKFKLFVNSWDFGSKDLLLLKMSENKRNE